MNGNGQSVTYIPSSYDELDRILDRYYSRLVDGEWYILLFGGRGYTLTLENYEKLKATLYGRKVFGQWEGEAVSDMELVTSSVEQGGAFTIERPEGRVGNPFRFAIGEFFPYVHTHPDACQTDHVTTNGGRLTVALCFEPR